MDYSRQNELFDVETFNRKAIPLHVIGAGATGSWVVTLLAKMGFDHIHVYDFDGVEEHNLPNQNFSLADIGTQKVDALAKRVLADTGKVITPHNVAVDILNSPKTGYVFILTDTVKSRKEIFTALSIRKDICGIIETRMDMDTVQVYSIGTSMEARARHKLTMSSKTFTDEEITTSACGISQTIATTASVVASIAVRQLVNFVNGEEVKQEVHVDLKDFLMMAL